MTVERAACAAVLGCLLAANPGAQTTFKTGVEAVRLDVSVMREGRPLRGLTANDFIVTDNDVQQQIESVWLEAAPLDIVMALDNSSSVVGNTLSHLVDAATGLANDLRQDDRGALITFSDTLERPVPLTSDRDRLVRALSSLSGGGATSLRDAVLSACALAQDDERRSVVLIFSDGLDTTSWLSERNVVDAVRRMKPTIHAIEMDAPRVTAPAVALRPAISPNTASVTSRPSSFLETITRAAGGRHWRAAQPEQLRAAFNAALDEMRTRYELTYYPSAARQPGWHRIEVRLKRGSATIAARQGYYVD